MGDKDSLSIRILGNGEIGTKANKSKQKLDLKFPQTDNNVAYVKQDGTKVYKGVWSAGEKNPLDTPYGRKILGSIWNKTKAFEKQGVSQDKAVTRATKEAVSEAKAENEKEIQKIMKRNKCNRHEAEVRLSMKINGISRKDAEKAVNKKEKVENSRKKANTSIYDPKTSLGFGYRQVLRYLQAASSCGYVLVKLDTASKRLARERNFEVVDGYVKIPKAELEKAAKEIEDKDNIDRREFEKSATCDRCGSNHHGAIKKGKITN